MLGLNYIAGNAVCYSGSFTSWSQKNEKIDR